MKITDIQQVKQYLVQLQRSTSGYQSIDDLAGGLPKGGVSLIGGRIAMGRSSLALNMVSRIAAVQEGTILFFSTRSSRSELAMRLLGIGMNLSSDQLFDGSVPVQEREQRYLDFIRAQKSNIKFITYTNLSLEMIQSYCRKAENLQLVVIDGPELICLPGDCCCWQYQEKAAHEPMDHVLQFSKQVATAWHVPVLLTANLHRSIELRKNKRPKLSDLKKIHVSEELVDQVLFLYRDRYYDPSGAENAQINVAKTPCGQTGTVELSWSYESCRFDEL